MILSGSRLVKLYPIERLLKFKILLDLAPMFRKLTLLLFVTYLFSINPVLGQVYRGIKEVEPYTDMLLKIDNLLQLDPQQCIPHLKELNQLALKNDNKTLLTVLEIYKGTVNYYTGQNDSAAVNFEKATRLAEQINNKQLRSTAAIRRLFVIDRNADPQIMLGLMTEEYEMAKENKDTLNMIYSLNGLAMYNERLDSTMQSIDLYVKALQIAKENNNRFEYGFLLNNLGLLKLRMHSNDDAYEDLQEGIKIAKELNNIRLELTLRENLGYYYNSVDSVDLAEKEYQSTLELANERNYAQLAYNSLVNLGVVARLQGDINKSDSLLQVALDKAKETGLYYSVPAIYITKAQIELSRKNYDKMNALLDSAKYYGKYTSENEVQEAYYRLKYEEYKDRNNFEKALEYYQKYKNFKDSLDHNGHLQIMEELQLKYDVQKKEKQRIEEKNSYEKKLDQQELDNVRLRQNIGIVIIILILIVAGFVIYYFRSKHKKEIEFSDALVNKLEEERGRIARDLHDGLGQSLIILKNKFNTVESNDSNAEKISEIDHSFADVIEEVRSISRSLVPPELRRLGLRKALENMLKDVEQSTNIMVTTDLDSLDSIEMDIGKEIRIYRIIQELINNTVKHSGASSLKVETPINGPDLTLIYQDNGHGFDPDKNNENSLGLRSIRQRVRYLHGTIKFEKRSKGMKTTIRFKHG